MVVEAQKNVTWELKRNQITLPAVDAAIVIVALIVTTVVTKLVATTAAAAAAVVPVPVVAPLIIAQPQVAPQS